GNKTVVDRNENEALVRECLRLVVHIGLVAAPPAAAVNPDDDRQALALDRRVDIEHLPFVLRLKVRNAALNLRLVGRQRRGKQKDEQWNDDAHVRLLKVSDTAAILTRRFPAAR